MGDTERLLRIDDIVILFDSDAIRCLVLLPLTPNGYFRYALCAMRVSEGGRLPPPTDLDGLAEIGKPEPNWELQGILGLAAFVLGVLAGK